MYEIPDHPIIRNLERTGEPYGEEMKAPRCPVCGDICAFIFTYEGVEVVGCDRCLTEKDAYDMPECFDTDSEEDEP